MAAPSDSLLLSKVVLNVDRKVKTDGVIRIDSILSRFLLHKFCRHFNSLGNMFVLPLFLVHQATRLEVEDIGESPFGWLELFHRYSMLYLQVWTTPSRKSVVLARMLFVGRFFEPRELDSS